MGKRGQVIAGALLAGALLLSGCSSDSEEHHSDATVTSVQGLIEAHGLQDMDPVDMIDHLDRVPLAERPTDLMASVMPEQLVLASATEEMAFDLPEDSFYLSIAPFVNQTHECYFHSLTTCVGELSDEEVHLKVTDDAGQVLIDEPRTTFDNGFVGVWVPPGSHGTLEISYGDKTGTTDFATDSEAATCITDLQLT